ncbi:COX3 oxidase, partial [Acromyrmex charruanus]
MDALEYVNILETMLLLSVRRMYIEEDIPTFQLVQDNSAVHTKRIVREWFTHHSLINKNINERKNSLSLTIILGIYFSILQLIEYINCLFTIVNSIYGSTFFIAIGFHGIHVIISTLFLICFLRLSNLHFSAYHHFGFEAAS